MIISIVGMPGAGKTTLAQSLATRFGFEHISAGNVARHLAENDPEVAVELREGRLAPRDKMNEQMAHIFDHAKENDVSLVVDGFPRYKAQLDMLAEQDVLYFILALDEAIANERLLGRGRSDDQSQQIAERLNTFREETRPLFGDILNRGDRTCLILARHSKQAVFNEAHAFLTYHGVKVAGT